MTQKKKTVAVLYGGMSPEHDVSIVTGMQVTSALDQELYNVLPVYVSTGGVWWIGDALRQRDTYLPGEAQLKQLTQVSLNLSPGATPRLTPKKTRNMFGRSADIPFDVALPAFHGTFGEDGRLQGLLDMAGVPYTGMKQLAAAILMDKVATKRVLADSGIPLLPYREIHRPEKGLFIPVAELEQLLGSFAFPCCVKPVHLGSSIGVAKVNDIAELADVLPTIFRYDHAAMLEPFVEHMVEYNVSVARISGQTRVSAIEKPKTAAEFLDFKEKYTSGSKVKGGGKQPGQSSEGMLSLTREINPDLPADRKSNIETWAKAAFDQFHGTGAPRIDFLSNSATGEVWLNEINPCPGSFAYFLWEHAAPPILFSELLDLLIREALDEHGKAHLPKDPTPEDARLFPRHA